MDDAKLVAASAIALAVTLISIFTLRPLAGRLGLVDKPNDRKRHRGNVPLIGGLCFFLGMVVGLVYLGFMDRFVASLLVPCALIVLTGIADDLHDLSVRARLIIQASAAALVIAATGIYLDSAGFVFGGLFGSHGLSLGLLGIPITIVAVIGLINAFNMLDGIDGLAASVAMVSIGSILLFAQVGWPVLGILLLLQVLFAALIPYLCVNMGWPDGRKIFMGDAGSTLIGFLLGWSLVYLSHRDVGRIAPVDALWCVALPVMDTLGVMVRRLRKGLSPFKPDRRHLHHLLIDTGCSPRVVLATIVATSGLLGLTGYALRNAPEMLSGVIFAGLLVAYVLRFQDALEWICSVIRGRASVVRTGQWAFDGVGGNGLPPQQVLGMAQAETSDRSLQASGVGATGTTTLGTLRQTAERPSADEDFNRRMEDRFSFLRKDSPLLLIADRMCDGPDQRPEALPSGWDLADMDHQGCDNAGAGFAAHGWHVLNGQGHRSFDGINLHYAGEPLNRALCNVAMRRPDIDIVYPVDGRPGAMARVEALLRACPNIHLIAPTDSAAFAWLMDRAHFSVAASCEMASEVASRGKPVLLMHAAGAPGSIDAGNVRRIGNHEQSMTAGMLGLLDRRRLDELCRASSGPAHDNGTGRTIVDALADLRGSPPRPQPGLSLGSARMTIANDLREAS